MRKLKKLILSNFEIGITNDLARNDKKLVKFLNFICFTWYIIILFFAATDYFWEENYLSILMVHTFQFCVLLCVQFLQHKHKYKASRVLFISVSLFQFFVFSNFILKSYLIEFFYILIPLFSLLFLKERWLHYLYLGLSVAAFMLPRYVIDLYDNNMFGDPTTFPILFVAIFLLVTYFKSLNIQNEAILEDKNKGILEDKALIESQKKELEEFQDFQHQFFINVAHEIRTPLTIVNGQANKLNRLVGGDEDFLEPIESIKYQSQKIQKIVTEVLDLSKMEAKSFQFKKTNNAIVSILSKIHFSFLPNFKEKNIDFLFVNHLKKDVLTFSDPIYLEMAINNIISNALKYTGQNGTVSILLKNENDEVVSISIEDNGVGISDQNIDKIFNRFYQEDTSINRAGGSGIGLSFSREVILNHNGTIQVKSKQDVGTTFHIELGIAGFQELEKIEQDIDKVDKATTNATPLNGADRSILIVDDQREMRDYLKSILNTFTIYEAENGKEALGLLGNVKPDLIITDYMMPEMNGYDFVLETKKIELDCPIVVLTARADVDGKLGFLRLGIDDYITKPFNEEELLIRIDYLLSNQKEKLKSIAEEEAATNPQEYAEENEFIEEVKGHIERNMASEIFGVVELADLLFITERTLYRRIKSHSGLTPNGLIREVKLSTARRLIEQGVATTVKDLADQLGYKNTSHFANLYEKRFGKRPLD